MKQELKDKGRTTEQEDTREFFRWVPLAVRRILANAIECCRATSADSAQHDSQPDG